MVKTVNLNELGKRLGVSFGLLFNQPVHVVNERLVVELVHVTQIVQPSSILIR